MSTKAKYITIIEARKKSLWVAQFLAYLGFCLPSQSVNLCADKKRAISLTKNYKFHWKIKHIEICWHWIWKKVQQKEIAILYISTKKMRADGLIKALSPKIFKNISKMIGITWAGHIPPSRNVGICHKNNWKVVKLTENS